MKIRCNNGIMINADGNPKKEEVIKDSFGILVSVNVNVTNHVMLENIWIMKIVNVEKD